VRENPQSSPREPYNVFNVDVEVRRPGRATGHDNIARATAVGTLAGVTLPTEA